MKKPRAIDYRALFDRLPTPYVLMDPAFNIVEMNEAYLSVSMRTRAELTGKNMFDAFPAEGESLRRLRASLEEAREGVTSVLPLLDYAIPRPVEQGGGLERRFWSCTHVPLRDDEGHVAFILQNTQDVTELQRLKDSVSAPWFDPEPERLRAEVLRRVEQVQELNRDLVADYSRLHRLLMQAPGIMTLLRGPDHIIELANRAFMQTVGGGRRVVGKPLREALPEIVGQGYIELFDRVFETGEAHVANGIRVLLRRQEQDPATEGFFDAVFQPVTDAEGKVHGIFIEAIDVTHRVRAAERQSLLMDELNHRVKNTLATVQAIALQTLRNSPPDSFADTFQSRLKALARTHDVLTRTRWEGAELRALLDQELHPYRGDQVTLGGPEVWLPPRMALALGLLFHELATNAAKYGALSRETGRLEVNWSITNEAEPGTVLGCEWREEGGPPVGTPDRKGFGSRLIEASICTELEGTLVADYRPRGLLMRFAIPLPTDSAPGTSHRPHRA